MVSMCKKIPLGFGTVHHFRHPLWGSLEYLPWIKETRPNVLLLGKHSSQTPFTSQLLGALCERKVCIEISYFHNILNRLNIHDEFWVVARAVNVSLWSLSPLGLGL